MPSGFEVHYDNSPDYTEPTLDLTVSPGLEQQRPSDNPSASIPSTPIYDGSLPPALYSEKSEQHSNMQIPYSQPNNSHGAAPQNWAQEPSEEQYWDSSRDIDYKY
jgi:hypothetical protein